MGRILMVVAPRDFRDEEYLIPRTHFESTGHSVVVASTTIGSIKGTLGTWVRSDIAINQCRACDYDAIVFVGGTGASTFFDSRAAHRLCREAVEANKVLGAICIAPSILANAGVLEGMRATCYPTQADHLVDCGAVLSGTPVTVSGLIVTADGPLSSLEFARTVVELMRH